MEREVRGDGEIRPTLLVVRPDNAGDVLLTGPAVRAAAGAGFRVAMVTSPQGQAAARLLPGVDEVLVHHVPWIDAEPRPLTSGDWEALVASARRVDAAAAAILTSSHQSPLPAAAALRLAGIDNIAAVSHDYAGSLLDHRIPGDPDVHEVERNLMVMSALGVEPDADDDGELRVDLGDTRYVPPDGPWCVVHPGCTVPARTWSPDRWRELVRRLAADRTVVVTGTDEERSTVDAVCHGIDNVWSLAGRTSLAELAAVLAAAPVVACGNTGVMHLAAAVSTPICAVFPPTVPLARWRPWRATAAVLGRQEISCAGCRARVCPVPGHPCVGDIPVEAAQSAIAALARLSVRSEERSAHAS
jgi:ADP-heptose:LPS heptosyltransferase